MNGRPTPARRPDPRLSNCVLEGGRSKAYPSAVSVSVSRRRMRLWPLFLLLAMYALGAVCGGVVALANCSRLGAC
jgi:hypothetical protein